MSKWKQNSKNHLCRRKSNKDYWCTSFVVKLYLKFGVVDFRNQAPVHAAALKAGMLQKDDDWNLSKLMELYSNSIGRGIETQEYTNRLFAQNEGGMRCHNEMLKLHGAHSLFSDERFYDYSLERFYAKMVKKFPGNRETCRVLLESFSLLCRSKDSVNVIFYMRSYDIEIEHVHLGGVVDVLARTGDIEQAVKLIKGHPKAQDEFTAQNCTQPVLPSQQAR